jgi:carboxyl-terminal processing protease
MSWRQRALIVTLLFVAIVSFGGLLSNMLGSDSRDYYRQVKENIVLFGQVYTELSERYVEEIDPEKFMRAGIEGMLDRLDPYTIFIEPAESDELQIMTNGRYFGVGMRIVQRNGWPTVADQPFEGTPARRAGIREGDQIIAVDSVSTENLSLSETAGRLRGKRKGTEVVVTIRRIGEEEPLVFHLIRDEIKPPEIIYSGFVDSGIGLIKLARFSRHSGAQVRDAIQELSDQGMQALIFDLRSNPGGLLDAAIAVADNFLEKGQPIVSTKGRWPKTSQDYISKNDPVLGDMPLVVLVDQFSASASEIVAGAVQDLDRGIVVGANTFGKGLVQTVISVDRRGGKQLKITTAKYYTPSGRLIQRPDVFNKSARSVFATHVEDSSGKKSVKKEDKQENDTYKTKAGRIVHGGGGITPDVAVENPRLNRFEVELLRKSLFFNFGLQYSLDHPDLTSDFKVDETLTNDFFDYIAQKDFTYKYEGEEELEKLVEAAQEAEYEDVIADEVANVREELLRLKKQQMRKSSENIKILIKREIAGKLWGRKAYFEVAFEMDEVLQKAVDLIKQKDDYSRILTSVDVGEG